MRQEGDPAFPKILWNRPVSRAGGGRLLLAGGHTGNLSLPQVVYGAAKAASLAGDRAKARTYYTQLLDICKRADSPGRPELAEARAFVGR